MNDCTKCKHFKLIHHSQFGLHVYTEDFCIAFGGWPDPIHCCYFEKREEKKE